MPKIAVIFDTNSCHIDRKKQSFFGQKETLTEIAKRATIIMPQIVIDELLQQNIEGTRDNIVSLRNNPLLPALGFDLKELDAIVDHEHATTLHTNEDLEHEIIEIVDTEKAYRNIRKWAITGMPPFNQRSGDGKKNSDKGVKDALVVCTVNEFLELGTYDKYYLACNDGRLKEYYEGKPQILCSDPKSILKELTSEFFDEYIITVIQSEIDNPETALKNDWLNINSDVVGHFGNKELEHLVVIEMTSKEILKSTDKLAICEVTELTASGGYARTHEVVSELIDNLDYYRQEELEEIKNAMLTNDQVYGIGTDEDIKTLAALIFNHFFERLTAEEKKQFDVYYELREIE